MGDRRHGKLALLSPRATKPRASKEGKLRLRVIFLDDSERTFEVEVVNTETSVFSNVLLMTDYLFYNFWSIFYQLILIVFCRLM